MIKKIIIAVAVVGFIVWFRFSGYADLVTFDNLKENAELLKAYVSSHLIVSALLYVILYVVFTALALPGAVIISISGGFIFGFFKGIFLTIFGASAGACAAFFFAKYLVGDWINVKYAHAMEKFRHELDENGYLYMLTLRLIPVFPFFLVNLLAGLANIRFRTFLWTTTVGIIPGGIVFIYAGSRLSKINSVHDVFSPGMLSAFILFGCLMLIPIIYKKIKG